VIQRSFRYRLAPTAEQETTLRQFAGTARFIYNLALEQRIVFWRQHRALTGRSINYVGQNREVTELRSQVDWIRATPSSALTQALRDLDRAYAVFFAGRARFPSPRVKGVHDSFWVKGREAPFRQLNAKWAAVRIPNMGWVKFRLTRPISGKATSATVSCRAGLWFVSFAREIEHKATISTLPEVGIDRGVANTVALSTGELLSTPATGRLERLKRRGQRILSRRKRGSNRYRKQRQRVARLAAKIVRDRADWRHKTTTSIVRRFGVVAVEDLRTASMVRANRGLARSIHEQGWRAFETVLAYKLEERGGTLIKVNPAYTSQTCSACETIDKASRESQASFACRHCGFAAHADTNAAINILRRSTAFMRVEGGGYAPDETRTATRALAA
jgi:putative transposase